MVKMIQLNKMEGFIICTTFNIALIIDNEYSMALSSTLFLVSMPC